DETGEAPAKAVSLAIKDAGIEPSDIDYVNAHGTSTQLNDAGETKALKIALGDHAYKVAISSTKSMIGHLLGAAGAVEAIATLLTINRGMIHPTLNSENPDPARDLDYVPNNRRRDLWQCTPQVRGVRRGCAEALPPAQRRRGLRRAGAHGPTVLAALSAHRRSRELRERGRRSTGRHAIHRGEALRHHRRADGRHRETDGRHGTELRRLRGGADCAARAAPQSAHQRRHRYRGRHEHQHPAAQPARGDVCREAPGRQPGG